MPQLISRMDDIKWLTPSIADILDQGTAPPGGDGSIREQMLSLQKQLNDREAPARIVNVRPTPSYTLFIAKPETIGRLGNRRIVTHNEIKRSLTQIANDNKDWVLGFLPEIPNTPDTVGILLRTDIHSPLSLRRLLVRSAFRDHPSTFAFPIGNTMEQRLIVRDLAEIGNLMVVGTGNARTHFINSMLLTLITLNTPGELRLAIAGQSAESFKALTNTPHVLARVLTQPEEGKRLLDGLVKELQRRHDRFSERDIDNISAYNALAEEGKSISPRIVILLDSLSDQKWQETRDEWIPSIEALLQDQGKAGIHLILTANQMQVPDVPSALEEIIPLYVVSRSNAEEYSSQLKNFHGSLMKFIDSFIIEEKEEIVAVEQCTTSQDEITATVNYWQQAIQQRKRETASNPISGRTGMTGVLQHPAPSQPAAKSTSEIQAAQSVSIPQVSESPSSSTSVSLQQAQALAAYLGWIGIGPLQDILGLSPEEAQKTFLVLQTMGIVEETNSPTPRFVRAINAPPKD